MHTRLLGPLGFLLLAAASSVHASTITIDFEGLADLQPVTTEYSGVTFSGNLLLTAGSSLDESQYPPHSGTKVITDEGGPITILLDTPATFFSAYFTYVLPLTVEAFDSADALVASSSSLFNDNDGLSGDLGSSPNELIQVLFGGGFSKIVITGDADFGGSFVMDDVTFGNPEANTVPEPSSFLLVLAGSAGLLMLRRTR